MVEHHVNQKIQELNTLIGLASPNGKNYKERLRKHQQLSDYYTIVRSIVRKLSTKRTLWLYDCASGRCFLSFYINFRLEQDGFNNVSFVCIDSNETLIERCKQTALQLGMTNMQFHTSSIIDFDFDRQPDIVYSLHACDDATDQMIYKSIDSKARHILSVSCCQHEVRSQMKGHSLTTITRYQPYKERLADMLADSLRALLLEAHAYKVNVFEFVATSHTPKNIMLRCERVQTTGAKKETALSEYEKLSELFDARPMLEVYLQETGLEEFESS